MLLHQIITESEGKITFNNSNVGYHNGQYDMELSLSVDGKVVGVIEYTEYKTVPAISYISIADEHKRQGYAKLLLKHLQGLYPDTEIEWGMLTDDGSKLYNSVEFKEVKSPYYDDFVELEQKEQRAAELRDQIKPFEDEGFTGDRQKMFKLYDELNDLEDEIDDIKFSLRDEKKFIKLIV